MLPLIRRPCLLLLAALALQAFSPGPAPAVEAERAPLASQSLLLDGQAVGSKLIVVGERGHILLSTDQGRSWEQRPVPTRATLTSVFFSDEQHGWAAGHDTTILRTTDGGASWATVHSDPESGAPVLDLWFRDAGTGYAVGAYGLFLATTDGGAHWEPTSLPGEDGNDFDLHLNQIRPLADGRLLMSAEAGHLLVSANGRQWQPLSLPYTGSMFGVLPLDGDRLLAFGLRGHLFRSVDAGKSWQPVATGTEANLNDAVRLRDGRLAVVGLAGTLLLSSDAGEHFTASPLPDRPGLTRVLETGDGALVLLGTHGARRLERPAPGGPP